VKTQVSSSTIFLEPFEMVGLPRNMPTTISTIFIVHALTFTRKVEDPQRKCKVRYNAIKKRQQSDLQDKHSEMESD
jgi:hypothetical protein